MNSGTSRHIYIFKTSFKNAFIGVCAQWREKCKEYAPYDSVSGECVVQRRGIRDHGSYRQASRLQMGLPTINYFENGAITACYIMLRAMVESERAGRLINRIMFCFYNDSTRVRW